MPDVVLPVGAATLNSTWPNATVLPLYPTPPATLAETQAAVGPWLATTLTAARAALDRRLPPKPGKKTGPHAYARVMILVADDSRRIGYDPWIAELADGLAQAGVEESRIAYFIGGQLDDPPLGLRMIRQLGEDACGRFAVESHRADRESDHDPEQDGLELSFLQERTLVIAARPVFDAPHWTNRLSTFLGRSLLARPLTEIIQHAAADAFLKTQAPHPPTGNPLDALLALEADGYAPLFEPRLARVIDAPFRVDNRGEMADATTAVRADGKFTQSPAVLTAVGATPTDLWFDNLLTAAADALPRLQPGGQLWVAGAADEGLPFAEWRAVLMELQATPREQSWSVAVALARRLTETAPALRYAILQLGAILQTAATLTWISPGLLPEADDDDTERPRREVPPGPRLDAIAGLADPTQPAVRSASMPPDVLTVLLP